MSTVINFISLIILILGVCVAVLSIRKMHITGKKTGDVQNAMFIVAVSVCMAVGLKILNYLIF